MNQTQMKYALDRVTELGKRLIVKAQADAKTQPKVPMTSQWRYELLAHGKVKLRAGISSIDHYTRLTDAFDFSEYEEKFDEVGFKAESARIMAGIERAKDIIVLGDEHEALRAIAELESELGV